MASDDVIELGSSDEETEPAPKKRKPTPNAMVHIPNKLPGITIKPSKNNNKINPASIARGSIGKSVTVTKVSKNNVNSFANIHKINGKPKKPFVPIKVVPVVKPHLQIPIQKSQVVPANCQATMLNSQLNILNPYSRTGMKTYATAHIVNPSVSNYKVKVKPIKSAPLTSATVSIKSNPKNLNKMLPPGITVKRTVPVNFKPNTEIKRIKLPQATIVQMSKKGVITSRNSNSGGVVELDDDEPASSSSSQPQWYLRPEQQDKTISLQISPDPLESKSPNDETEKETNSETISNSKNKSPKKVSEKSLATSGHSELEHQNNKEPDKRKYIEITIDDSPVKPPQTKKGFTVGAELAITIEDSPNKNTSDKVSTSSSDDERGVCTKERKSKKKLDYPKAIKLIETVEIEFEPFPEADKPTMNSEDNSAPSNIEEASCTKEVSNKEASSNIDKTKKPPRVVECIDIVEIEESPVKPLEVVLTTTPTKSKPAKPDYKMMETATVAHDDAAKDEFNPTYQSFINLCFQLENSEDMEKIVEKKIKAYYRQVPKEYTDSEYFIDMVTSKIMATKADPEKMYLYIKDVVDELNLQRKIAKAQPTAKEAKNEEQEKFLYGEKSEFDSKRQRQIRKLEKTLKKLHRAIQKLEEQEVDFDDEEDSVYLLTERYKERMVRVHAKLCQLTNTKMPSEARVKIEARPGQPKGPAKRIEKWINRKVPIGTPLPFPDFHDVLRCVREANQEDKLGWNEADVMEEARDLFTRCGKKLQRRRQENEWRLAASRIPVDVADPAEESLDLKRKLEENRRVASQKEVEVFNKYADRQNLLKLEAVEIGDKEAEESPVESDDEEPVEDCDSLIDKTKRKERLKRLLHEKSKKETKQKESQSSDQPAVAENSQNKGDGKTDFQKEKDTENDNKDCLDPSISDPTNSDLPDRDNKEAVKSSSAENKDDNNENSDKEHSQSDKVHSLSDDSNKIDSDIDELHLLQKLYSENELNASVVESSDSSSPIAISDTTSVSDKTSGDERRTKKRSSEVISIENSSYSESEEKECKSSKDTVIDCVSTKRVVEEVINFNTELEYSNDGVGKETNKTNNEVNNACLEDILLASSDEDDSGKNNEPDNQTCVNLRDDTISIGETVIEGSRQQDNGSGEESRGDHSDKNLNTDSSSVEGMDIGPTEINSEDQTLLTQNNPETIEDRDETISIPSVETVEDDGPSNKTDDQSVDVTNVYETSNKSVETPDDENVSTVSKLPIRINDDKNVTKQTRSNSPEMAMVENDNETSIKSVETSNDENVSTASKPFIGTIDYENVTKQTSSNPVEMAMVVNYIETSTIPVETPDDGNVSTASTPFIGTVDDENVTKQTISNSAEMAMVKNCNETSIKSVETSDDNDATTLSIGTINAENVKEQTSYNPAEIAMVENDNETCVKSNEILESDTLIRKCGDSSKKEEDIAMNTTENTETNDNSKIVRTIKENHDFIPEAIELDSNIEQTL